MLENKTIRDILWGLLAYTIVFIVPFAFLTTFEFSDWKYEPFVTAIIGTFMGGGTIAIITAGLLVFQKRLDSEHKRKEHILETRIELYQDIIDQISARIKDDKITDTEKQDLKVISFKLNLLAEIEVQAEYEQLLSEIGDDKEFDKDNIASKLNDLIDKMNKSIGVVESINPDRKEDIKQAKDVIQNIRDDRYSGYENKEDFLESVPQDLTDSIKTFFEKINSEIVQLENVDKDKIKYTKTGGLTAKCGNKKFVGIKFKSNNKLEIIILRDKKRNYIRPAETSTLDFRDIREYSPKKSNTYKFPWGYDFYYLLIDDNISSNDKETVLKLIKDAHRNVMENTHLQLKSIQHRKLAAIFCDGDEAEASPWVI